MKKFDGVIFDMDGLLFDTEKIYCQANIEMGKEYGMDYTEEYYIQYLGVTDEELMQHYVEDFPHLTQEKAEQYMKDALKKYEAMFLNGEAEMKPGARELLDYLKENNIPMVIASNNNRLFIEILLNRSCTRHYFKGILSVEDTKTAKPHPEIVEKAMDILETNAKNTLMIEDSHNGAKAGINAGVSVIMVPDLMLPSEELKQDLLMICKDLHEVKKYLEK